MTEEEKKETAEKPQIKGGKLLAAIRIRGLIGLNQKTKDTLNMLHLFRKNYCVVIEDTPSNSGMIKRCKDYITWGEIDSDVLKELIEKRGEKSEKDPKKTKKFFRLNSPKGGFERKGIKTTFTNGGALGYRGNKINNLIKKMV